MQSRSFGDATAATRRSHFFCAMGRGRRVTSGARREDAYLKTCTSVPRPPRRRVVTSSCTSVPRPPRRRVLQHPRPPRRHVKYFVVYLGTSPAEKSPAKSKGSPGAQRPRRSATAVAERETRKRSPGDDVRRTQNWGCLNESRHNVPVVAVREEERARRRWTAWRIKIVVRVRGTTGVFKPTQRSNRVCLIDCETTRSARRRPCGRRRARGRRRG